LSYFDQTISTGKNGMPAMDRSFRYALLMGKGPDIKQNLDGLLSDGILKAANHSRWDCRKTHNMPGGSG
jgi:hypothetical protein